MPGANVLKNAFRSSLFIGTRSVRKAMSSGEGGGIFPNIHTPSNKGKINIKPTPNGIQNSETPQSVIKYLPTAFTKPEATIKLMLIAAPNNSVLRLPSKKAKTSHQIIPSGNPLTNNQIQL